MEKLASVVIKNFSNIFDGNAHFCWMCFAHCSQIIMTKLIMLDTFLFVWICLNSFIFNYFVTGSKKLAESHKPFEFLQKGFKLVLLICAVITCDDTQYEFVCKTTLNDIYGSSTHESYIINFLRMKKGWEMKKWKTFCGTSCSL